MTGREVTYHIASRDDLSFIAMMHIPGWHPFRPPLSRGQRAIYRYHLDKLDCVHRYDPKGLILARVNDEIAGFALCVKDTRELSEFALHNGYVVSMAIRFLTGRYGFTAENLRRVVLLAMQLLQNIFRRRRKKVMSRIRIASIPSFIVLPQHRRGGIGGNLLRRAVEYAISEGASVVEATVRPDNTASIRSFLRNGFEIVGDRPEVSGKNLLLHYRVSTRV